VHPVDRVGVRENVVRYLPIGMLVGIAEVCHPKRSRIGEGPAEVGRSGSRPDRILEGVNDAARIVTEQLRWPARRDPTSPTRCNRERTVSAFD
jgi:hypothetical protein